MVIWSTSTAATAVMESKRKGGLPRVGRTMRWLLQLQVGATAPLGFIILAVAPTLPRIVGQRVAAAHHLDGMYVVVVLMCQPQPCGLIERQVHQVHANPRRGRVRTTRTARPMSPGTPAVCGRMYSAWGRRCTRT